MAVVATPRSGALRVEARLYGALRDFLPSKQRDVPLTRLVAVGTTVKDLVESLGVPHTEVDVIVDGASSVSFDHRVADGDRLSVYPPFVDADVAPVIHLMPAVAGNVAFVLDVHLGRLARLLRLLGMDALWRNDLSDTELIDHAVREHRILLTRDRGVLKRSSVEQGYYVRESVSDRQIVEVIHRFCLADEVKPFKRCLECNGLIEPVAKAEVEEKLPPRTRRDYEEFTRCSACGRVYWRGSHYDRLVSRIAAIEKELCLASEAGDQRVEREEAKQTPVKARWPTS